MPDLLAYSVPLFLNQPCDQTLRQGADPNLADLDGMTPLMVAAANGNMKGVKLLLQNGAERGLARTGSHPEGWLRGSGSGVSEVRMGPGQ
jgi:ankyrin repeat protein